MNAYNAIIIVEGAVIYAALAWKFVRVLNARHTPLNMAILACLFCAGAAYPFERSLDTRTLAQQAPGPPMVLFAHELFISLLIYALICFFVLMAIPMPTAQRRLKVQAVPLAAALFIYLVSTLTLHTYTVTGAYPATLVAAFFLTADLYTVYGFSMLMYWTRQHIARSGRRLRLGLVMVATGLLLMIADTTLLGIGVVSHWIFAKTTSISSIGTWLLAPGIILFLIGLSYPGLAARAVAAKFWCRHLVGYMRLEALWTLLHDAFPEHKLPRAPNGRNLLGLNFFHINHRYYRRVIECRDSLVLLSPYIAITAEKKKDREQPLAHQIRSALALRRNGHPVGTQPVSIAVPDTADLAADAQTLARLSRQLRRPKTGGQE